MVIPGRMAILLTAAMVLAAGCEAPLPREAQGRDVVRPDLGFALDVPDGWTWHDLAGDVVLEIVRQTAPPAGPSAKTEAVPAATGGTRAGETPADKRSRVVVHVVVVDREGLGLDAWADQAIEDSQELQSDLETSGRQAARLADGREALRVTLRNPRSVHPLVQRMLLAVTDARACGLLATGPEADLAAAENELKECFDTFVVW